MGKGREDGRESGAESLTEVYFHACICLLTWTQVLCITVKLCVETKNHKNQMKALSKLFIFISTLFLKNDLYLFSPLFYLFSLILSTEAIAITCFSFFVPSPQPPSPLLFFVVLSVEPRDSCMVDKSSSPVLYPQLILPFKANSFSFPWCLPDLPIRSGISVSSFLLRRLPCPTVICVILYSCHLQCRSCPCMGIYDLCRST